MSDSKYKCENHSMNPILPICLGCVNATKKRHDKMLEFIKQLADESVYEKYENLNEMNWAAFELLKEIGLQ